MSVTGLSVTTDRYLAAALKYRSGQMTSQEIAAFGAQTAAYIDPNSVSDAGEREIIDAAIVGVFAVMRGVSMADGRQELARQRQLLNFAVAAPAAPSAAPSAVPSAVHRVVVPVAPPRAAPRPPAPAPRPAAPAVAAGNEDAQLARAIQLSLEPRASAPAAPSASAPALSQAAISAMYGLPAATLVGSGMSDDNDASLQQALAASMTSHQASSAASSARAPAALTRRPPAAPAAPASSLPSALAPLPTRLPPVSPNTWGSLFMRGVRATYAVAMPILRQGAATAYAYIRQHPYETALYGGAALAGGAIGLNLGYVGGLGGALLGIAAARSYERQNQQRPVLPAIVG